MEQKDLRIAQYISLAAIMLLAPVIPLAIQTNDIDLDDNDKTFVKSFIQYGYYILEVLGVGIVFWFINAFLYKNSIIEYTSQGITIISIIMIMLGFIAIIRDIMIVENKKINYKNILSLFHR